MKNEFVPYRLAKALKKLGFDEECFAQYENNTVIKKVTLIISYNSHPYLTDEEKEKRKLRPALYEYKMVNSKLPQWSTAAPLYQQVFRWFKTEHNLIGFAHPTSLLDSKDGYAYEITNFDTCWDESEDLSTYKKAELACLKHMMEIIKSK